MSFEKEFPSLKGKVEDGELKTEESTGIGSYIWLPMVERNCLDKQKVIDAIDKVLTKYIKNNLEWITTRDAFEELSDELNL